MVKNNICLRGGSAQNALSVQICALGNASMLPMSRIDLGSKNVTSRGSMILEKKIQIIR